MSTIPLASLLSFPNDWQTRADQRGHDGDRFFAQTRQSSGQSEASTSTFPPDAHAVVTTAYPAPASFAPLYYARQALRAGHAVVWLACTGCGEAHVRRAMRGALGRQAREDGHIGARRSVSRATSDNNIPLVYLDALDTLLGEPASQVSSDDARPALLRLQHRLGQAVEHLSQNGAASSSSQSDDEEREGGPHRVSNVTTLRHKRPVTVIMDDASALAWSITSLSALVKEEDGSKTTTAAVITDSKGEDPRIRLLRDKRRQGNEAIHRDEVGHGIAEYIEELRAVCCRPSGAVLITHLSVDNTSISPPSPRTPATRGGQYGVGTGFDADDAGEEDEDEELYEDVEPDVFTENAEIRPESSIDGEGASKQTTRSRPSGGVAASSIDWRVDSLLRRLLPDADVWIELRGLRSGRARDCHGELCVYGLARPCLARGIALPTLPMPGDPLLALRTHDRSATPLKSLSHLSLRPGLPANNRIGQAASEKAISTGSGVPTAPLRAFAFKSLCEGRDAAMLFRIEPSGEAVAWSRGSGRAAVT